MIPPRRDPSLRTSRELTERLMRDAAARRAAWERCPDCRNVVEDLPIHRATGLCQQVHP